ncbi:hypothetical protein E2562_031349 [Oryza meyeriana var. granulata]|uniref:DUF506 domain-containing protein n=1 Tax=Oryza meyeriana var. granulata TaxID=110450 RepID=A0A6G1DBI3_9ORYZ|nr:hypothetical protein E2562_031349 [Oryza meyeriana var. granulata]
MPLLLQLRNQLQCGMETRPTAAAPARVSRFRRLLVRVSAAERLGGDGKEREREKEDRAPETEVGSVGLDRMVLSFMEDATTAVERPPRGRCGNCFNGSGGGDGSDDEEFDFLPSSSSSSSAVASAAAGDALEALKGLVQSASVAERNLLADASRIAERCRKGGKKKADVRRAVADGLAALGYDAAVCRSRWDKTPSYPAGEHEYIDAVVAGAKRLVVEVDFRSEFEVARSTKAYRAALQALPPLFVGTPDRLGQIVAVVAEAARQSLRKKGLHVPPWRKPEYMRAKWLSPQVLRCSDKPPPPPSPPPTPVSLSSFSGEFELLFDGKTTTTTGLSDAGGGNDDVEAKKITVVVSPSPWRPVEPEAASKKRPPPPPHPKGKVVTGLAAVL